MPNASVLIRGGRVLDPSQNLDLPAADVLIVDGLVKQVGKNLSRDETVETFDAAGCLVSPGWIDLHAHLYQHATALGVDPDATCLRRGVTTAVDAGSAGAMTFAGLRKYVAEKSRTRVLALLHVACHGLAGAGCAGGEDGVGGESDHLNALKVRGKACEIRTVTFFIFATLNMEIWKKICS